jgi:dihydroorotase-like cyclic amidohydrolase
MLTEAARGRLSVCDIVRRCSYQPARIWGLRDKGHLEAGADADFVLVDGDRPGSIAADRLHSRHSVTPYDGWPTVGAICSTYLRGRLVAADGEVLGDPHGQLVRPSRTGSAAGSVSA